MQVTGGKPPKGKRPPYRPKLTNSPQKREAPSQPVDGGAYQPDKVVVLDLPLTAEAADVRLYFANFGHVLDVVLKSKPFATTIYAFVQFRDEATVERALEMAPHMVCRTPVRVLRAFKRLPSCPFPGMERPASPPIEPRQPLQPLHPLQPLQPLQLLQPLNHLQQMQQAHQQCTAYQSPLELMVALERVLAAESPPQPSLHGALLWPEPLYSSILSLLS